MIYNIISHKSKPSNAASLTSLSSADQMEIYWSLKEEDFISILYLKTIKKQRDEKAP